MDSRGRGKPHRLADVTDRGRISVLGRIALDEVEDLLLTLGQVHRPLLARWPGDTVEHLFENVARPTDGHNPAGRAAAIPPMPRNPPIPQGYTADARACGGIGRRARLRALWTEWSVEVRVLSGALGKPRNRSGWEVRGVYSYRTAEGSAGA